MIGATALLGLIVLISLAALVDRWAGDDPDRRVKLARLLGCPYCGTQRCGCGGQDD